MCPCNSPAGVGPGGAPVFPTGARVVGADPNVGGVCRHGRRPMRLVAPNGPHLRLAHESACGNEPLQNTGSNSGAEEYSEVNLEVRTATVHDWR